ncbi:hypothetical protein BRARA_C02849 [Brassica rapa]|uniref:Uncharacterized protein n=3 Tax=Brassica TaxID=3705 RepID=A0A397ZZ84_BRACM|nr:uncharacterized protein LOC106384155 [Brassica napus]KAG5405210.1 hypothetical protein IGI04_011329 [Brassica rapa subsp. trilocularis]RID70869.1 hypothetical protein BRARA_C02849 [Brassica rapa]KAH0933647.1 hypothetical protein HID58_010764 [Brassica napus]CAF2125724.1 unnamed protein product [Brassica napus]CAG7881817.1 unnamed protein product [Brassica rapa]
MKMASLLRQEEEEEHHCSLSRLSVCCNYDGDDADGEPSDSDVKLVGGGEKMELLEFSDSDNGSTGCLSLPATPPRLRRRQGGTVSSPVSGDKAYASENEARKEKHGSNNNQRRRRRRLRPEYPPWVDSMRRSYVDEQSGYGGGVVVVTRPIGGGRPLCMDLGEVKACQDLGFEIEPGQVSYTGSTMDTSSGGNSPNHRISSPGDDPKEVKARLKAWAHAVAFVSTTHHHQPPNSL